MLAALAALAANAGLVATVEPLRPILLVGVSVLSAVTGWVTVQHSASGNALPWVCGGMCVVFGALGLLMMGRSRT
jgi:hypothetical protein